MSMIFKAGSVAAVGGAAILLVATVLHPMSADPGDPAAAFAEYAADRLWVASHLGQFLGVALIFVGLFALRQSLADQPVAPLADLALGFAVAALCMAAVLQAVDGVALKAMADRWAAAPDGAKQAAFEAAFAVRQIEIGAASFLALLFGTATALFGLALAASTTYPGWLGWLALVGGIGTAVGGVLTAFTGFSHTAMTVAMPFNLILIVWIVLVALKMWRRAG